MTAISQKKLISSVLVGSILETYDYMLYGYFAMNFALNFFPVSNPTTSLLLTFMIFAAGFITRPLGAAIFGNLGDKYGRKNNLLIAIMLMAIPTAIIGLLPTYDQIGISATILLTLCRLLQGLAVGAEFAGSMVYMVELAPADKRTFYGSLSVWAGYTAMLFTATFVSLIMHYFPQQFMNEWGWRFLFLFGSVVGLVGLYLRATMPETPAFQTLVKTKSVIAYPFFEIIKTMPLTIIKGIGIVFLHASAFYLLFVYLTTFFSAHSHILISNIAITNSIALLIAVITLPLAGLLGEKFDKKRLVICSCLGFILLSYPLFYQIDNANFFTILKIQVILTVLLSFTSAYVPTLLADMFPVSLRYSGLALCYNVGAVISGGTAPLILTYLVEKTKSPSIIGIYLMVAAAITLISVLFIKKQPTLYLSKPLLAESE